ncbi:MAG: HEAT repeat domain-containing protein [bacterium]
MRSIITLLVCLLPVFAQDDVKDRVRAARDLRNQGSSAIPQLQNMLSDPDSRVRVEAVKSIVEIGTQLSIDPLVAATRDNDAEVQIRATDGLVNFYLPGYVSSGLSASLRRVGEAISAKFTDTNDAIIPVHVEVRPEVIEALGKLARGGATMESRANAARAVGILRGRAAIPDLVEAMKKSKNDQVLYESLVAIRKIRDREAAPQIEFLLRDLDEKVQIAAIETTGLLQNHDALPKLRAVLAETRKRDVRRAALTAIAMLPEESNRPVYEQYLNDRDDKLRAAAAEGIARLKNPSDVPAMEKMFNEERKMEPRLSAAFALVMLGRTELSEHSPLQYLVNTLASSAWRGVARPFLVELARDEKVLRAVEQATRNASRNEKVELAYVLGMSGDRASLEYIDWLIRDPNTDVSGAALEARRNLIARLP